MIPLIVVKVLPSIVSSMVAWKAMEEEGKTERTVIATLVGSFTFIVISVIWKAF